MTPTPRQMQIIEHLSNGLSHELIAKEMVIATATVRKQTVFAFERTGAVNGPALVAMALRQGWIK